MLPRDPVGTYKECYLIKIYEASVSVPQAPASRIIHDSHVVVEGT